MLPAEIAALVREEQQRQSGRFVEGTDLETYLQKLDERAEIVSAIEHGRCRGFVAFYCNNLLTRRAYITLVVVAPHDRASGLGRALVARVLDTCRDRGFTSCGLEVRADNTAALALYAGLGFSETGERDGRKLLERAL